MLGWFCSTWVKLHQRHKKGLFSSLFVYGIILQTKCIFDTRSVMLFIHAFCPGQCCGVWFSHGFTQNSGVIFFPAPQTFIKYLFLYGWEGPVLVSSPCSICFCFRVPWPPIYDTATTSLVRSLRGHTASLTAMAVSPNGLFVATCATDLRVKVYGEAAIGYSLFEFSAADSFPACFSTHSCTHATHKHANTRTQNR